MGFFSSLFGKSDEDPNSGLSADAIQQKIAGFNEQIAGLKHKLPSASAMEGMEKSTAWLADMQAKIKAARDRGQVDDAIRLEGELKEASKKTGRINKHVEEIQEQILRCEDEIELLERALSKLK